VVFVAIGDFQTNFFPPFDQHAPAVRLTPEIDQDGRP